MRVCSLFSGIGGFELGLSKAGFKTVLMCESDKAARSVLARRFPDVPLRNDVQRMKSLPSCDVLVAGWPCQDLSQAGRTAGIAGDRSGLVADVFRLLKNSKRRPEYIILENVAFAMHLHKGHALAYVTKQLESLGYQWAYRILDSRHFGLPQRRRRLFILGSLHKDPGAILFDRSDEADEEWPKDTSSVGFYWTEGNTGIGWSPGAIPPLKGGSGLAIPSPPAVWAKKEKDFRVPGIEDAERMQGFPAGWTAPKPQAAYNKRVRWKLVGNAVSVPVAAWLGRRIASDRTANYQNAKSKRGSPNAGRGAPKQDGQVFRFSEGPSKVQHTTLDEFVLKKSSPLSARAAKGFYNRITKSTLKVDAKFLKDLGSYVR